MRQDSEPTVDQLLRSIKKVMAREPRSPATDPLSDPLPDGAQPGDAPAEPMGGGPATDEPFIASASAPATPAQSPGSDTPPDPADSEEAAEMRAFGEAGLEEQGFGERGFGDAGDVLPEALPAASDGGPLADPAGPRPSEDEDGLIEDEAQGEAAVGATLTQSGQGFPGERASDGAPLPANSVRGEDDGRPGEPTDSAPSAVRTTIAGSSHESGPPSSTSDSSSSEAPDAATSPDSPSLLSAETSDQVRRALSALSMLADPDAPDTPNLPGGAALEASVRAALRPMLAQWLETHLPAMVERELQAELARIKGRSPGSSGSPG